MKSFADKLFFSKSGLLEKMLHYVIYTVLVLLYQLADCKPVDKMEETLDNLFNSIKTIDYLSVIRNTCEFCFVFLISVCVNSMHLWPPDFGLKYWIKKATSWKCSKIVCEFPTGELKKARKSSVETAALHRRGCRRKLGGWCACFQCTAKVHYCKMQSCINGKRKSALMQST